LETEIRLKEDHKIQPDRVLLVHHFRRVREILHWHAFKNYGKPTAPGDDVVDITWRTDLYKLSVIFLAAFDGLEDGLMVRTSHVTNLHHMIKARWSEDMTIAFETEHRQAMSPKRTGV
jgi:hypothetical protein